MSAMTSNNTSDTPVVQSLTTETGDADVDLTNLTEKEVNAMPVHTNEDEQHAPDYTGTIRVRIPEHHTGNLASVLALGRREVIPRYTEYPEEFDDEASPSAYKEMKQKLAASTGDEIVFSGAELTTLWDAVATYICDLDVEKYDASIGYLEVTLLRAERAINTVTEAQNR